MAMTGRMGSCCFSSDDGEADFCPRMNGKMNFLPARKVE
jgi:hypothetical protein